MRLKAANPEAGHFFAGVQQPRQRWILATEDDIVAMVPNVPAARVWIAEGMVTTRGRITVEEVGESYFQELINRSMILPARVNIEGVVKSCRVHDIVRDIIVSISREDNFVYSTEENVPGVVVREKFRHVAYHCKSCTNVAVDLSRVRSLTTFGDRPMKPAPSLCSPELRMLRTLDLKDAQFKITQKDMNNIGLLRHLKYVNAQHDFLLYFGHSNIYAVPGSIGKLQSLQVLDLRGSCISALGTEVTKLQSLRSLRCSKFTGPIRSFYREYPLRCLKNVLPIRFAPLLVYQDHNEMIAEAHLAFSGSFSSGRVPGVAVPRGIGNLKALQILEAVDLKSTSTKAIEELGELSQLRKLSVTTRGAAKGKCKAFCKALERLASLCSFYVDSVCDYLSVGTLEWLVDSSLSPPPLLRNLKLIGKIGKTPAWFGNLTQLGKMYLEWTQLEDLEILGALPKLMLLQLFTFAYTGEKLTFRTGAFPSLRKLVIFQTSELKEMRFEEEGASPCMESIQIDVSELKLGIIGIKHLPRLKEISLGNRCKVAGLNKLQAEVNQHRNNPVLRLKEDRSYHDLGDVLGSGVEERLLLPDDSEIQPVPS